MNFSELKTELAARGFDYLAAARQGQYINDAYAELCGADDWPFLETTTSGTSPLTISDLRSVLYVVDTVTKTRLSSLDVEVIVLQDADFTTAGVPNTAGSPAQWFLDGLTTLRVYPANTTDTLAVRYIKNPADLTGTDTPLIPTRYHSAIVDVAEAMAAARDESDDRDQSIVRAEVDRVTATMNKVLMARGVDQYVQSSYNNSIDY